MAETAPGDELCLGCRHPRDSHTRPGLCVGTNPHPDVFTSNLCVCPGFKPLPQYSREGYSTWDPERDKKRPREVRFERTSSRHEIGDGTLRARGGHQDDRLARVQSASPTRRDPKGDVPEWVMFGIKHDDGTVTIHASTGLTYIKLRQDETEFDKLHRKLIENGVLTSSPWDLNARLVGTMEMDAANYVEALRRLMGAGWQNGSAPEPEGPSTADLQRLAALEDAARTGAVAIEASSYEREDEDEIVDAEIVDEDDDE